MKRREAKPSAGRWLSAIERVGNALPHPITLFALLTLAVVVISALCAAVGLSVTGELIVNGEVTETTVEAVSLLTGEGLAYIFTSAVTNFTTYAPLGMVLVAMLGVGVAEQSGLIGAVLKRTVQLTPRSLVTPVIVFLGVMSNIASDAGYVVLIPLGAMVFRSCGRHPLAGLAAAFAGVSGGFSANLIVGSLDPMLAGISEAAALVNVITSSLSISPGLSPSVIIRMIRSTRTAVFPLPAAAETRRFLSLLSITCLCSFVQFTPMTLHCLRFRLPDRLCFCGSLFCLLRFCFPLPPPQSPPRLPPVSLP